MQSMQSIKNFSNKKFFEYKTQFMLLLTTIWVPNLAQTNLSRPSTVATFAKWYWTCRNSATIATHLIACAALLQVLRQTRIVLLARESTRLISSTSLCTISCRTSHLSARKLVKYTCTQPRWNIQNAWILSLNVSYVAKAVMGHTLLFQSLMN